MWRHSSGLQVKQMRAKMPARNQRWPKQKKNIFGIYRTPLLSSGKCKISDLPEENILWAVEIQFLRGLRLFLYWILRINALDMVEKSVPFGIYCLMSLLAFAGWKLHFARRNNGLGRGWGHVKPHPQFAIKSRTTKMCRAIQNEILHFVIKYGLANR